MNSSEMHFIGVDPASSNKDFNCAVLDDNLNLLVLSDMGLEELISYLTQQEAAVVAVSAPINVNQGLVKQKLENESSKPGQALRGVDIRLAEYELRKRGINITGTPSREEFCPAWMQAGFSLYLELSKIGYQPYGAKESLCQFLETQPYACFCAMLEGIPFDKSTLEGRLQRQLLLNDKSLRINDAMEFFEEITRFKLMKGILPMDVLYSPEQLDVLVAAYTAWVTINRPIEVISLGDASEGKITLPVRKFIELYK